MEDTASLSVGSSLPASTSASASLALSSGGDARGPAMVEPGPPIISSVPPGPNVSLFMF